MDGRSFVKCLRNSALINDDFNTAEADLVFTKYKAKGSRKIDAETFVMALEEVAVRKEMTHQQVQDAICLRCGRGAREQPLPAQKSVESIGPERFFYDTSSYTGTHRNGGPSTTGSGRNDIPAVDFKDVVNRDGNNIFAEQQRITCVRVSKGTDHEPVLLGRTRRPVFALKGPERFFYDKATYTGTHRNGGPDMHGSGIPKEGYSDLKELVCRDHTQDDDLNRRRHAEAASAGLLNGSGKMRNSPRKMQIGPKQIQSCSRQMPHGDGAAPLPMLLGAVGQNGSTPGKSMAKQAS